MWVEPDTNMPTGESLRPPAALRPALFREDLRQAPHRLLAARLLRLLAGAAAAAAAGRASTASSPSRSTGRRRTRCPFDLFWWEGLDGSRVLAHTFDNPVGGYNAEIGPRAVVETWRNYPRQAPAPREPARLRLRRRRRRPDRGDARAPAAARRLPRACPALRAGRRRRLVRRRSTRRSSADADLPVWVGEIYLELHRGTLTTQGRTKYPPPPGRAGADHRRDAVEHGGAARRADRRVARGRIGASCCATSSTTSCRDRASARSTSWRRPSSRRSSPRATGSSSERLAAIAAQRRRAGRAAAGVLVVNPDLSPRPLRLASAEPLPGGQAVEGGSVLAGDAPRSRASPPRSSSMADAAGRPDRRRRGAWRTRVVRVDARRRRHARQRLRQARRPRGAWPAAATRSGPTSTSRAAGTPGTSRRAIAAQGEEIARAPRSRSSSAARIAPPSASSAASATARSCRPCGSGPTPRALEFKTDIDWHDRRILLKARFPLAIRSDHATFECAHGVIRRPTHRNTSWDAGPLRGRRASLRRPLRARLRRGAPERRQVRPPRPRQRARPQPAALAGLSRPARRRGPAELHLRAPPACRRLADRRRARRGRGPEPAAARPPGRPPPVRPPGRPRSSTACSSASAASSRPRTAAR